MRWNALEQVLRQSQADRRPDKARAFSEVRRVLAPGGLFIFNVWDCIEENDFAATVTTALEALFPQDPPRFLIHTPHGYHVPAAIARDLHVAEFRLQPRIDTVTARSCAESANIFGIACCQGTTLRAEIVAYGNVSLAYVTDIVATAIQARPPATTDASP